MTLKSVADADVLVIFVKTPLSVAVFANNRTATEGRRTTLTYASLDLVLCAYSLSFSQTKLEADVDEQGGPTVLDGGRDDIDLCTAHFKSATFFCKL